MKGFSRGLVLKEAQDTDKITQKWPIGMAK